MTYRDWVKHLQDDSDMSNHQGCVTVQYFPHERFVGITVPPREVKSLLESLGNVKRVVFQPNDPSRQHHGTIEIVFDDGSKNPFMVTVEIEDFGYPESPFLTARNDLRVGLYERGVPKALIAPLPGESTLEIRQHGRYVGLVGKRVI